jgi:hypothetical protein
MDTRIEKLLFSGELVECSKAEYPKVRSDLQTIAGQMIDKGDTLRGMMCLEEVRRLDKTLLDA